MITFGLIAAAMLLVALAVILPPVLQRSGSQDAPRATSEETAATVSVYRERLADLEREYERGHLSEPDYAAAQAEAKRELLQYVPQEQVPGRHNAAARWVAVVTAFAVPALALAVYAASGRPDLLASDGADRLSADQVSRYTEMGAQERIRRLEAYLDEHPAAPRAWSLLAGAYRSQEQYQAAADAFGRAIQAGETTDARLIARRAEALLLANQRRFTEDVQTLIDASLRADPRNPLGLMLAGHAALTRGDAGQAADYWQRLAEQIPENDRRRQLVDALIARAEGEPPPGAADGSSTPVGQEGDTGASVHVRLRLSEALRSQAQSGDTVFVFARPADAGGGPPLAVSRTSVAALPTEIELADAQAMTPDRTLSSAERVVVTARISRSGDVTTSSGDLQGQSSPIPTDARDPVEITIDQRIQ